LDDSVTTSVDPGPGRLAADGCATPSTTGSGAPVAAPARHAGTVSLPDKSNFDFAGTHLNAAYTHPVGIRTRDATQEYIRSRMLQADRNWPARNSRDEAVALFARLVGTENIRRNT